MTRNNKPYRPVTAKNFKVCTLCEKPYTTPGQCCRTCKQGMRELKGLLNPERSGPTYGVSISKLLFLKHVFNVDNIIDYVKEDIRRLYIGGSTKQDRLLLKRTVRKEQRELRHINYIKWETTIPSYISILMKENPDKEFLTLSGERHNPNVHYICKRCGVEQCQTYNELKIGKSHNCAVTKSSGEVIIEDFLKKQYEILTQRETLFCKNPITGRQLPYDIEIPSLKVIVEIQGPQHYNYIEYFHGSEDNFHYQQRKDDYKRRYAEKNGYKVIYINYDEIENGQYKQILEFRD